MSDVTYANTLLQSFEAELIGRLQLRPVTFKVGQEIEFPGMPIKYLFFLEEGMASMTTTFKNGREVEVGMFGYGPVIGVSALMGTKQSLNRVYTQIAGWGYRCRFEVAAREFERCGSFQRLALRYVQAQLVQPADLRAAMRNTAMSKGWLVGFLFVPTEFTVTSSRCRRSSYPTCLEAPVLQ